MRRVAYDLVLDLKHACLNVLFYHHLIKMLCNSGNFAEQYRTDPQLTKTKACVCLRWSLLQCINIKWPLNSCLHFSTQAHRLCSRGCSTNIFVIHLFIQSLTHPFPWNLQNIITPKQKEVGSWNLDWRYTPHHVKHFVCHVTDVKNLDPALQKYFYSKNARC